MQPLLLSDCLTLFTDNYIILVGIRNIRWAHRGNGAGACHLKNTHYFYILKGDNK